MKSHKLQKLRLLVKHTQDPFALDRLLETFTDSERKTAMKYAFEVWDLNQHSWYRKKLERVYEVVLGRPLAEFEGENYCCFDYSERQGEYQDDEELPFGAFLTEVYSSDSIIEVLEFAASRLISFAWSSTTVGKKFDNPDTLERLLFHDHASPIEEVWLRAWSADLMKWSKQNTKKDPLWRHIMEEASSIRDPWFQYLMLQLASPSSPLGLVRNCQNNIYFEGLFDDRPNHEYVIGWAANPPYHDNALCIVEGEES
jgi:hypothetical protein